MAEVYSRFIKKSGIRVWYAECKYVVDGRRKRAQRSTGVRDDGSVRNERTAQLAAADIERALALGKGRVARPTTLAQAVDALVDKKETKGRSAATLDITIQKARNVFDYFGSATPLESLTEERIAEYTKHALALRAPPTVERELRELKQSFVAAKIEPPAFPDLGDTGAGRERERFLVRPEQMRLLMAASGPRRDHILMYLHTGASKSELFRIEPRDCLFEQNEVRIRGTKTKSRDRFIPMTPEVREILWRRLGQTPMFEPWGRGNADRDLRKWARAAELGPVSFNDLRRTFATVLAMAGVPILHLMHMMGHKSTRMLERVYARVGQGQHMHDAVKNLPALRAPKALAPDNEES
jgi:integrase